MAQLLIRDVDPAVIERLEARAKARGHPLEAEVRLILQQAVAEEQEEIRERIERIRAFFAGRTFSDSAELIREDRER